MFNISFGLQTDDVHTKMCETSVIFRNYIGRFFYLKQQYIFEKYEPYENMFELGKFSMYY